MPESKNFRWVVNPKAEDYEEEWGEFVPLEVTAVELWRKTRPSISSEARVENVLAYLRANTEVYTPILVRQPLGGEEEDPAADLNYYDGRHTVYTLAHYFGDVPVTVLVPRQERRKIAELLEVPAPG